MTLLCFDAHRTDGLVWSIQHRGKWLNYSHVEIQVPMLTDYKGPHGNEPRAYLFTDDPVSIVVDGRVATIQRSARAPNLLRNQ